MPFEGHDTTVLESYPFGSVPTWRVIFEAYHLQRGRLLRATALLRSHGFVPLNPGNRYLSSWHNIRSQERVDPARGKGRGRPVE